MSDIAMFHQLTPLLRDSLVRSERRDMSNAVRMVLSEENFHEIVDGHVAPLMERLGFDEKKKGWFYRFHDDCTNRLACGFSKTRGEDSGSLSVTVCVGFKVLQDFLSDCKELARHVNVQQDKRACTMAANLGHLADPPRYLSWEITPDSNSARIGRDICVRIEIDGLKFFADYGSLERVVSAWRNGSRYNLGNLAVLYLAAYDWLQGNRERAVFDLKDAVISADAPSTRHIYTCLLNHLESLLHSKCQPDGF